MDAMSPAEFASVYAQAQLSLFAVTYSTNAATGPRYSTGQQSMIQTFGGGASYFPGNAAGGADATSLYL